MANACSKSTVLAATVSKVCLKTGPALNTIWGTDERLSNGTTVKVDENYVRESILEPSKILVEGYGTTGSVSKMPSFQGKLSDKQIGYLIDYIRYLKNPDKFPARDAVVVPKPDDGAAATDPDTATDDKATDATATDATATDATATDDKAADDKATDDKAADDQSDKKPENKDN